MIHSNLSLRRRFEQNQEDCTFTVLALLPTAMDNILAELQTERITFELQQQKAAKLARNGEPHPSELGSGPPSVTDDDGRSMASLQSESGIHASQMGIPPASLAGEGPQDGGQQAQKARKTKLQLWNDLKISCRCIISVLRRHTNILSSNLTSFYLNIYAGPTHPPYKDTTQSLGSTQLPVKRGIPGHRRDGTVNYQLGKQ